MCCISIWTRLALHWKMKQISQDTNMSKKNNHWPDEWEQGLIKTTNAMGVMFKELSPAAEAFVHYARHADGPLLDIGCAYGVATIPALNNGGELIGCDLSDEHLSILRQSISSDLLQKKLTTTTSSFPYALSFQPKSLSGILISNVLHFMDGETIVDGLSKCWQWLKPDGKLFINVMTPHLSFYHQLIPEYQHRVDAGVTWPGIFNPKLVASDKWKDNLPDFVHLF